MTQVIEFREAIEAADASFSAAFARRDAAAVAALYTRDAIVLPPNSEPVSGTDIIRNFWAQAMSLGIKSAVLRTTDVEAHGEVVLESGNYELKLGDGSLVDRGKYLVVWKTEGGDWKLYRDIWNSSMPRS